MKLIPPSWICFFRGHRYTAPAAEHGKDIPAEWLPVVGDSPDATVAKFKSYIRMTCRRCSRTHPTTP